MIHLSCFDEFAPGMGFPSLKDSIVEGTYIGKEQIVEYLKHNGWVKASSPGFGRDAFTGELIRESSLKIYTDGVFMWNSELTYHVEKYNIKLPDEFIKYVLEKKKS